ncbi:MAG: divergent polysaccharide deacetylase family protein [Rhabdaerophilum sp.]
MAFDSLATPLGVQPKPPKRASRLSLRRVLLAFVCAGAAAFLTVAAVKSTRQSGNPVAVSKIERMAVPPGDIARIERPDEEPQQPRPEPAPRSSAADVEQESGVRVIRQNGGQAPGASVIRVPESTRENERLAPAPDPRLVERIALGFLPKTGEGGITPRRVYARPFANTDKPRIAVVLTGVGVSARSTADAISRLSGDFTLAFAPYGRDLEAQVMRARRDGHEIVLQVPMEPFDFPDSDPGPHTLRASSGAKENIERLHWLMTRFSGYVGIMNYMGGKLLSTPTALQPVLDEMAKRGLLFLDDGSAARGSAMDLATRTGLPAIRADRVVEAAGSAKPLRTLLAEAESIALRNGRAVIAVPALSANIETLMNWEAELASRNIVVAPLSAVIPPVRR